MQPILYSFRRCPYAMRARMALAVAKIEVEHREVVLRNKPQAMLDASPKGTVPVLVLEDRVIDESLDVICWALSQNDPDGWLVPEQGSPNEMTSLITENDGPFKQHLDRYKYPDRHGDVAPLQHREGACEFLSQLETRLSISSNLFGSKPRLADFAIFPFVRQFSRVDTDWFAAAPFPKTVRWLNLLTASKLFLSVMHKYPPWVRRA